MFKKILLIGALLFVLIARIGAIGSTQKAEAQVPFPTIFFPIATATSTPWVFIPSTIVFPFPTATPTPLIFFPSTLVFPFPTATPTPWVFVPVTLVFSTPTPTNTPDVFSPPTLTHTPTPPAPVNTVPPGFPTNTPAPFIPNSTAIPSATSVPVLNFGELMGIREDSYPEPPTFHVAVIVDTNADDVSVGEAAEVINQSSDILFGLSNFDIEMVDYVQYPVENPDRFHTETFDRYIASNDMTGIDGIVVFGHGTNNLAETNGSYYQPRTVRDWRAQFVSDQWGDTQIPVIVVNYGHRYAACGYGSNSVEFPTSQSAIGGECRGQNLACAAQNNYSICSDSTENLYASSAEYLNAANIVHEIMHMYLVGGADHHYGTPECTADMQQYQPGWSPTSNINDAQRYNYACPTAYLSFILSYQP